MPFLGTNTSVKRTFLVFLDDDENYVFFFLPTTTPLSCCTKTKRMCLPHIFSLLLSITVMANALTSSSAKPFVVVSGAGGQTGQVSHEDSITYCLLVFSFLAKFWILVGQRHCFANYYRMKSSSPLVWFVVKSPKRRW